MEDMDIKQQFHLLQKEVEAAVALSEDTKLNLLSAIGSLQIQVEVLRRFMERCHMGFACRYPELREEVLREVDPEWLEGGGTRRGGTEQKRSKSLPPSSDARQEKSPRFENGKRRQRLIRKALPMAKNTERAKYKSPGTALAD